MTAKYGDVWRSPCGAMELRCGDWAEVLADVKCDTVITDPPYSERTHGKQRHGRREAQWVAEQERWASARGIDYAHLSTDAATAFVDRWAQCAGWLCIMNDSALAPTIQRAMAAAGRTVFAPLPVVQRGMGVRLTGDGPSSWTVWLLVARPKSLHRWGTLPGAYVGNPFDPGENTSTAARRSSVVGSKPLWLMKSIVRDYSRPGDLICDPCAGGGTTLLAAAIEGRRAIGAEIDPETYAKAVKRLSAGYTPGLFAEATE